MHYVLTGVALLFAAGGATAATAPTSISASDRATGAKAHPEFLAQFGGAYTGPQADYVRRVGQRIAVQSGLSNSQSDFTITTLNSPVNNAFAIPGGYVYISRQLLALMNDEAELASVLGHEVGHVAARHSNSRSRTSTVTGIGAAILGVLTGSQAVTQLAGQAAQLYTLRFSRQQEYQADDLGIRYLARGGYDPLAASTMLASLAAQSRLDAQTRNQPSSSTPTWASTHPDPASRVTRAASKARDAGTVAVARNRDAFLNAIDGMLYDDDPAQGVVEGRNFRHPGIRVAFTAPEGFALANGAQAVAISGSGGQAQFTGATYDGNIDRYVAAAFAKLGGGEGRIAFGPVERTRVNGIDAAFASARANSRSGQVDVTVFAYAFDANTAYHFVVLTPGGRGVGPFADMLRGVRRLTTTEVAAIKPRRIDVVAVRPGDTVASLAGRMAYPDYRLERFLTLNALKPGQPIAPGTRVKLVVVQ